MKILIKSLFSLALVITSFLTFNASPVQAQLLTLDTQNFSSRYVEENENYLSYTGTWSDFNSSLNSGNSAKYTSDPTSSATINFIGSSIEISGYKAPYYGIADVYIDGIKTESIDYYSSATAYQQKLYVSGGLSNSSHTLKIVWTGRKNPLATATNINIDFIIVKNDQVLAQSGNQNVTYGGSWSNFNASNNSGGNANYSNGANAWVSTSFTGSSLKIVGFKAQYYGIANVFIDGTIVGTIDFYSGSTQYKQSLFEMGGLTNDVHTVKIVSTGNKNTLAKSAYINFDYILVGNGLGKYEENCSNVSYTGSWVTFKNSELSQGTAKYTDDPGAYYSMNFWGSSVTIGSYTASYYGLADVYIDDFKVDTIDYYSPNTVYQQRLFQKSGLSNSLHTIKVVRTGTKNSNASSTSISLDFIEVGNSLGSFNDANALVKYSGRWSNFSDPNNLGGTAKYSDDPNSFVSMTFTGSSLKLIGYKAKYYGIAHVYIDNTLMASIDYYSPDTLYQQLLFQTFGLSDDTHVLKIVYTGLKNPLALSSIINVDNIIVSDETGKFEENSSNITYNGSWSVFASPSNSGNSAVYSEQSGASLDIRFIGPSITIAGYKACYYGIGDVYIDGVLKGSIDFYSPTSQYQQTLFQTNGLSSVPHIIRIVNSGRKNPLASSSAINLDFIHLGNGLGTFQDSSPDISYSSSWSTFTNGNNSGTTAHYSNDKNSSFSFNFTGSYVKLIGYKSIYYGIANVYIDGIQVGVIDYYSPSTQFRQTLLEKTSLSPGFHQLKVISTGNKNINAVSSYINLDNFIITNGTGKFEENGAYSIQKTIVLDPGHGYPDPGAVSNGLYERDINLAVVLKLRNALEEQGYEVKLTRDSDYSPASDYTVISDLQSRVDFSNNSEGDIFVSIHCDASSSPSSTGVLGTYFRPNFQYTDDLSFDQIAADNWQKNATLANAISRNVAETTAQLQRPSESHAFWVLRYNEIPSALIELGFLTNLFTANQMRTSTWQYNAALGITNGIKEYFNNV